MAINVGRIWNDDDIVPHAREEGGEVRLLQFDGVYSRREDLVLAHALLTRVLDDTTPVNEGTVEKPLPAGYAERTGPCRTSAWPDWRKGDAAYYEGRRVTMTSDPFFSELCGTLINAEDDETKAHIGPTHVRNFKPVKS